MRCLHKRASVAELLGDGTPITRLLGDSASISRLLGDSTPISGLLADGAAVVGLLLDRAAEARLSVLVEYNRGVGGRHDVDDVRSDRVGGNKTRMWW